MWLNNSDSGYAVVLSSDFVKHLYDYRPNWTQSCYHYLLISFIFLHCLTSGTRFSKVLITFRAWKAVLCRFSIQDQSFNNFENVTKKLSVNEAKLTGCELGTVILFNWFWFQNLPAFNFQSKQMAKYFPRNDWNVELQLNTVTVKLWKPWTPENFQECWLCTGQSQ